MLVAKRKWSILFLLFLLYAANASALLADFTVTSTIGCAPFYASFTNISSGATSYDWYFGDGSPHSTVTSPTHTYSSPGSYTVTLTAYNSSGGSSTKNITINVYDAPDVYFRAVDTSVCVCNNVSFIDSSVLHSPGTGTYYWQFGTGDVSTSKNPFYAYCTASSSVYTVILKVTNSAGCFSSLSKPYYIHVYSHPAVDFSTTTPIICGLSGTVAFTSSVSGGPTPYTYEWDFGDGSPHATTANPTHAYSSLTYRTYNVTLIVTSKAGCRDTITKNDFVSLRHIIPSFTTIPASGSICANEYLIATNTSSPSFDTTIWKWGDGDTSYTNPAAHLYGAPGTYTLQLISYNGICFDSIARTITVHPLPTIKFGATPLTPCPAPVSITFLDSSSTLATHLWRFGDGATSTLSAPTHVYTRDSFFDVTLVGSNSFGCKDSLTKTTFINIYGLNTNIYVDGHRSDTTGGCIPYRINFSYHNTYIDPVSLFPLIYPYPVSKVLWDFGDGDTSTAFTPSHTYTVYGVYKVKLTVTTKNGCTATDSIGVLAGDHSTPGFYADRTTACVNQRIFFINTSTPW